MSKWLTVFVMRFIAGTYKADDRIPSVREYAVMLQVNTNTAVKAYELLSREEIIYNRRGLGYFVSAGAVSNYNCKAQ